MKYLLILLLAGCASGGGWMKQNASGADFYQDRGFCNAQAHSVPFGVPNQVSTVFVGCMQGKGWQWANR